MTSSVWRFGWIMIVVALVAAACGSDTAVTVGGDPAVETNPTVSTTPSTTVSTTSTTPSSTVAPGTVEPVLVSARSNPAADPSIAGRAISEFGTDIFAAARAGRSQENVILSPTSIAIALAMVEPGASGDATQQFRDVLHVRDPEAFHASMNALEQDLEGRVTTGYSEDDESELRLGIANAAYVQRGYPFEQSYLDVIGSNYGSALNEVDFAADPDAVAHEINAWVADQTEERITDLIADGVLSKDDVLALVNALYMNASWLTPFDESLTIDDSFTLLDGSMVDVPMMSGFGGTSSSGDGWVGATKNYVGGLSIEFILPDEGRLDEIANNLALVFRNYRARQSRGSTLLVPRMEARTAVELTPPLMSLGLTAPYETGNLMGIANDPRLVVRAVIHETFIAIDEQGTEAAAATAVVVTPMSGPAFEPVPVILDRPFLFRVVDNTTETTLFIGQILDPTE